MFTDEEKRTAVKNRYAATATKTEIGKTGDILDTEGRTDAKELGYTEDDLKNVPCEANMGLGCGSPLNFISLSRGEKVLDLGSGGGLDCFIAAGKVGKKGQVTGIDFTPEMVELSKKNAQNGNYDNVRFIPGDLEKLPLQDNSIDTVISNCVINLVPDKKRVISEAFRVLKPGGQICLSDIVIVGKTSRKLPSSLKAYTACLSGAIPEEEYLSMLAKTGFTDLKIKSERIWPFFHGYLSLTVTAIK